MYHILNSFSRLKRHFDDTDAMESSSSSSVGNGGSSSSNGAASNDVDMDTQEDKANGGSGDSSKRAKTENGSAVPGASNVTNGSKSSGSTCLNLPIPSAKNAKACLVKVKKH